MQRRRRQNPSHSSTVQPPPRAQGLLLVRREPSRRLQHPLNHNPTRRARRVPGGRLPSQPPRELPARAAGPRAAPLRQGHSVQERVRGLQPRRSVLQRALQQPTDLQSVVVFAVLQARLSVDVHVRPRHSVTDARVRGAT